MSRAARPTLILGGKGQLGKALARQITGDVVAIGREQCDVTSRAQVEQVIGGLLPALTINCSAMTGVDLCEREPAAAGLANAIAPGLIADACRRHDSRMVQISTDFVFDGDAGRPYWEWDATGPINTYGRTKLEGEELVAHHLPGALVIRTAWLFSDTSHGFLKWLQSQRTANQLAVVNDCFGSPTAAADAAATIFQLARDRIAGTVHVVSGGDPASRFEMATHAFEAMHPTVAVVPQAAAAFPRDAARPVNSSLSTHTLRSLGYPRLRDWRDALSETLKVNS
ncbi:MAG: dTDP-4-dehydrorhamnose reductase [Acidimicrobiia bacterium]